MSPPFVPAHQLVSAPEVRPKQWALMLHGIFGSGANWRTFARRYVQRRPEVGLVLVDLRMHGDSLGAAPPHTVQTAADDLVTLTAQLDGDGREVRGVCGHSFGGKVALLYAAAAGDRLAQAWVLDSDPAARPEQMQGADTTRVLEALEGAPPAFAGRDEFIDYLTGLGFSRALAQWLAMNVAPAGDHYRLRLDTPALRALLTSYYQTDAFPIVEAPPCELRFVLGGASTAVSDASRRRLTGSPARVDIIPDAGHWLHVEALDPLLDIMTG